MSEEWHPLCRSSDLEDSGQGQSFDVEYAGQTCRAFAVRYEGQVHAYLNRCTHVAMELDWQLDRYFDVSGHYLICPSHGAMYRPTDGACVAGPGRGPLMKIAVEERDGLVYWRGQYHLRPVQF